MELTLQLPTILVVHGMATLISTLLCAYMWARERPNVVLAMLVPGRGVHLCRHGHLHGLPHDPAVAARLRRRPGTGYPGGGALLGRPLPPSRAGTVQAQVWRGWGHLALLLACAGYSRTRLRSAEPFWVC